MRFSILRGRILSLSRCKFFVDWLGSGASVYPVNRIWNELHSHERRDEDWTVVSGSGQVVVDGVSSGVSAGDVIDLLVGCKHTVIAFEDGVQIIEVQVGKGIRVGGGCD